PLLALVVLIFAIAFSLFDGKYKVVWRTILSTIILLLFLIIINIERILIFLYNYLAVKGIEVSAITKSINNMNSGDGLSSGRVRIYEKSLELITKNPIYGNGISYFQSNAYGNYLYNLFLQLLLETCIIISIPVVIVVLIAMRVTFSSLSKSKENYA